MEKLVVWLNIIQFKLVASSNLSNFGSISSKQPPPANLSTYPNGAS